MKMLNVKVNNKKVESVIKNFMEGKINKSNCIIELFECGMDSNEIKRIEILGCMENSMVYNVISDYILKEGISDKVEKSGRNKVNVIEEEIKKDLEEKVKNKEMLIVKNLLIDYVGKYKKNSNYIRKILNKIERENEEIKLIKMR